MPRQQMRALLVSLPGLVREATCATLASLGDLNLVGSASGALTATHLLQHLQVQLLLVDANLPDEEVQALLGWAKGHCPQILCLVMTMTSRQRHQALSWGADAAIQRFDLSEQLPAVLSQLPVKLVDEPYLDRRDPL